MFSNWNKWSLIVFIISLLIISPILSIFYSAFSGDTSLWPHLFSTVLPRYTYNTFILMLGVGILSLIFGISTAWIVTRYDFVGKNIFEWALLLPAAVPAYVIAYTYTDLFEYAGPFQNLLRNFFNWDGPEDYWFPEVRSIGGAILVMSSVLYPYVYLMTRASFIRMPISFYETGSIYDKNIFYSVALPLSRPAIIAGLSLVLMETISDFGTVDYFAIETLTLGVFNVWLGMNSISGAAQISSVLFFIVVLLLTLESSARKKIRYHEKSSGQNIANQINVIGFYNLIFFLICFIPIFLGFIIPTSVLLSFVFKGLAILEINKIIPSMITSLTIAIVASALVMLISILMVIVSIYKSNKFQKTLIFLSSCGYAFPGTILAVGVVVFYGLIYDLIFFNINYYVAGITILLFAYIIRFLAVGNGSIKSGITKVNPNIIDATKIMGLNFFKVIRKIIIPLMYTNIFVGATLVFVDVLKELPMTLLLRPFNFETLATYVYQYASDELLEECSLAALMIVLTGIGPVILLNSAIKKVGKIKKGETLIF